ncbi:MAG TPA: site-2 protease family protein [Pirellulales bacterium]|nr:site-2 protease family protein [Pirellulales bacterium]
MRDLLTWNISLGRWAGVQVRLHVFFVLFAVVALHLASKAPTPQPLYGAAACLGLLLASVLAHEAGHCFLARRLGGHADQIVIWPFGGLVNVNVPHEPQNELAVALAGPLVNLAVCLVTAPWLLIVYREPMLPLLNPLTPPIGEEAVLSWQAGLMWAFWINWLLALVNLLPAYPLDGGRVLRSLLWATTRYSFRDSAAVAARVAKFTALALWLAAWLVNGDPEYAFAALPLALIGVLLFFGARQETERLSEQETEDAFFGYDFSQGYTSLEKTLAPPRSPRPGMFKKWLAERRAARLLRQQQLEAEEERRVDDVLARLHESGPHSLSDDDRALLDRVSARYRNRPRS